MPQMDTPPHNYMNGPAYFNQQPLNAVRHEFMPEISKLDNISWGDNAPRQMAELQEKQHVSVFYLYYVTINCHKT